MKASINVVVLTLLAAVAWAQPPATQPIAVEGRVLLLAFEPIGEAGPAWVGTAVQQNLLAELSRVPGIEPLIMEDAPGIGLDPHQARLLAERNGAQYVIYGSFQSVEADLRITAQVLDVANNVIKGGLRATGPLRDLFALQDELADQARRALPRPAPQRPQVADADLMLRQPPGPALREPVRIARGAGFEGSDLEWAVRRGRVDGRYLQREVHYHYDLPYYTHPWYGSGYPIFYRPIIIRPVCPKAPHKPPVHHRPHPGRTGPDRSLTAQNPPSLIATPPSLVARPMAR